jgi:hypothetical protein
MLPFKKMLPNFILEAVSKPKSEMSPNTKGVLHELLVGYHLNGGKHMDRHPNAEGESPQQAHDRLKNSVSKEDYTLANSRAKAAADDLRKTAERHGPIHSVHWTSKPGDLHRSTGIHASQKEDASDLVIHTKNKKGQIKHHGVSLKVSDKPGVDVPVSNPGIESTLGGKALHDAHKANILKQHPKLAGMTCPVARKEYLRKNPAANEDVRQRNTKLLNDLGKHMHTTMSNMPTEKLADHIRHQVLHAHATPMQAQGHNHIRHTTTGTSNFRFAHANPALDHEHILKDHKNITVKQHGAGVVFYHKGEPFARQRVKFSSQSDPLSSIKGSGNIM